MFTPQMGQVLVWIVLGLVGLAILSAAVLGLSRLATVRAAWARHQRNAIFILMAFVLAILGLAFIDHLLMSAWLWAPVFLVATGICLMLTSVRVVQIIGGVIIGLVAFVIGLVLLFALIRFSFGSEATTQPATIPVAPVAVTPTPVATPVAAVDPTPAPTPTPTVINNYITSPAAPRHAPEHTSAPVVINNYVTPAAATPAVVNNNYNVNRNVLTPAASVVPTVVNNNYNTNTLTTPTAQQPATRYIDPPAYLQPHAYAPPVYNTPPVYSQPPAYNAPPTGCYDQSNGYCPNQYGYGSDCGNGFSLGGVLNLNCGNSRGGYSGQQYYRPSYCPPVRSYCPPRCSPPPCYGGRGHR